MPTVVRQELTSSDEIAAFVAENGRGCAWSGCQASFKDPMPPEWRWLVVYWWPEPLASSTLGEVTVSTTCDRDAALCPAHARELESQLAPLARWADAPVSGKA